jgi:hypothetical protein
MEYISHVYELRGELDLEYHKKRIAAPSVKFAFPDFVTGRVR